MIRGCRIVNGVPPALGSVDRNGATVVLSAVPSLRIAFELSALNRSTCACTTAVRTLKVRRTPKSSSFERGSYRVPGDDSLTVMDGSPLKRAGRTIPPGVQPGTVQSFGYRVEPLVMVQFRPPLSIVFVVALGTPG